MYRAVIKASTEAVTKADRQAVDKTVTKANTESVTKAGTKAIAEAGTKPVLKLVLNVLKLCFEEGVLRGWDNVPSLASYFL